MSNRAEQIAFLQAVGLLPTEDATEEPAEDPGPPSFDGGARETAPSTERDIEAEHNETVVQFLRGSSKEEWSP
jgi:hypothetical protein